MSDTSQHLSHRDRHDVPGSIAHFALPSKSTLTTLESPKPNGEDICRCTFRVTRRNSLIMYWKPLKPRKATGESSKGALFDSTCSAIIMDYITRIFKMSVGGLSSVVE